MTFETYPQRKMGKNKEKSFPRHGRLLIYIIGGPDDSTNTMILRAKKLFAHRFVELEEYGKCLKPVTNQHILSFQDKEDYNIFPYGQIGLLDTSNSEIPDVLITDEWNEPEKMMVINASDIAATGNMNMSAKDHLWNQWCHKYRELIAAEDDKNILLAMVISDVPKSRIKRGDRGLFGLC